MTRFYEVPMGASTHEVIAYFGKPDKVDEQEGIQKYYYSERLENGFRVIEERYYCLTFKDGALIGKSLEQENQPPYEINSYDLQTTYGDGESPQGD